MAKASVRKQPAKAAAARKQPAKAAAARKQPAKAAAAGKRQWKAAVLGGSIAGLMAGLVLHHRGFEVVLYERQPKYTRSIQWSVRQSFIDYLYSVDKDIAERIYKLISPISHGYRYMSDKTLQFPDGAYKYRVRDDPHPGDGVAPKESCEKSLDDAAVGIIRARELETRLRNQLRAKPKVKVFSNKEAPDLVLVEGKYALSAGDGLTLTPYDLIVVCVGAGWSRDKFPIKFNPVSRERAQVSCEVDLARHGMITQYQHAKIDKNNIPNIPFEELLYSTFFSQDDTKTTSWVIGDVSSEFLGIMAKIPKSQEAKRNRLIEKECGKIGARTLHDTDKHVLDAGIKGVRGDTVRTFPSQAKISSTAYAGDNLVLAGDAVGAGHWAVGGGMHVAGMCHQRRLDVLAAELQAGKDRKAALNKYSKGVLTDTLAWIWESIEFYYLSIPKNVVENVFGTLVDKEKLKDDSINVPDEIEKRIISLYFGPKYLTPPKAAGFTDTL